MKARTVLAQQAVFEWLVRASCAAAYFIAQLRKAVGLAVGCFLFGYFILGKQNKVTRLKAKTILKMDSHLRGNDELLKD